MSVATNSSKCEIKNSIPHIDPSTTSSLPSLISTLQTAREDNELHWLISSVIMPEFEQILETLQICGNMLLYNSPQHPDPSQHIERGPAIKLPVSSTKSEVVKGIIVRDGIYVTQMTLSLKEAHFNRHIHKIYLDQPILLPQLITAKESIDSVVLLLQNFNKDQNHTDLINSFETISAELSRAKQSLQFPIDPSLVFPLHRITPAWFRPELPSNLSLDLYVNQAELCIDLKNLHRVTEEPWCHIDPVSGKSYVDKIRDDMKYSTNGTSTPLNLSDLDSSGHHIAGSSGSAAAAATATATGHTNAESKGTGHGSSSHSQELDGGSSTSISQSALKALGSLLKPKLDPQEYITKCYTYDNSVVMVNRKIEVSCPDPLLVSTFTKLDGLENVVQSFLHNLRVVCTHEKRE